MRVALGQSAVALVVILQLFCKNSEVSVGYNKVDMSNLSLFALPDLKPIDPDIEAFFMFLMALFGIGFIGIVLWFGISTLVPKYLNKRAEKIRADKTIWFDAKESVIHHGSRKLRITEDTVEHFVCKLVFSEPEEYHSDVSVLEAAREDDLKQRTVYQAVKRLNAKANDELRIRDLFIRNKSKTALNKSYR